MCMLNSFVRSTKKHAADVRLADHRSKLQAEALTDSSNGHEAASSDPYMAEASVVCPKQSISSGIDDSESDTGDREENRYIV